MSSSRRKSAAAPPPRTNMIGTVLPHDSMRGIRTTKTGHATMKPKSKPTALLLPLPPPPPSAAYKANIKLLAAAGRDLFRQGMAFDGVVPMKQEPRHPAVTPNLLSIPENTSMRASDIASPSQLIVVVGGPLNSRGEPGLWVSNRIAKAIQLYWQIMLMFAEQKEEEDQQDDHDGDDDECPTPAPLCYIAPTGGEGSDEGIVETEAIRNALVVTGISPHHIVMDCTATNLVDNALQLVSIVRHLHARTAHIVTSNFQLPRVRMCYDELLGAASSGDLQGVELVYHGAPDGLTATERTEHAITEHKLLLTTRAELATAVERLQAKNKKKTSSTSRVSMATRNSKTQPPAAASWRPSFHSYV